MQKEKYIIINNKVTSVPEEIRKSGTFFGTRKFQFKRPEQESESFKYKQFYLEAAL